MWGGNKTTFRKGHWKCVVLSYVLLVNLFRQLEPVVSPLYAELRDEDSVLSVFQMSSELHERDRVRWLVLETSVPTAAAGSPQLARALLLQ